MNTVSWDNFCPPEQVHRQIKELLREYNGKKQKTLEDIIDFHVRFERIHPFQDGNGRVGRLILFKECLANNPIALRIHFSIFSPKHLLSPWDCIIFTDGLVLCSMGWNVYSTPWNVYSSPWNVRSAPWNIKLILL